MALKETMAKTADYQKKYDFYKKLGYSEVAACVLACFNYGDSFFSMFSRNRIGF